MEAGVHLINRTCLVCGVRLFGSKEGHYVCDRARCAKEFANRKCEVCGVGILHDIDQRYSANQSYPVLLKLFPLSVCPLHAEGR